MCVKRVTQQVVTGSARKTGDAVGGCRFRA